MEKIKQKAKIISIFIIMSIIICSIVATVVYATDFGSELISISDNVEGATKGTPVEIKHDYGRIEITGDQVKGILNGKYTSSTNGGEAENFEIDPGSGILNLYANAYCANRGTGLSSAGEPIFSTKHSGTYNANEHILFDENSSAPSWKKNNVIIDFLENGEIRTANTASNFNCIIYWRGDLKNIDNKNGKLITSPTNIVTYSHVYGDKVSGSYYSNTKSQQAIWGVLGQYVNYYPDIFKAGKAIDELENQIEKVRTQKDSKIGGPTEINVRVEDSEHPGTVWIENEKTYRVGPFHMEDYAYVYSEYVKPYSGKDLTIPGINGAEGSRGEGFVGGIDGGSITLKDDDGNSVTRNFFTDVIESGTTKSGPKIVFKDFYGNPTNKGNYTIHNDSNNTVEVPESEVVYPFPGAVFYIDIPRDITNGATTLSDITFNYRETRTDGNGVVTIARYASTAWKTKDVGASSCTYTSDAGHTLSEGHDSKQPCEHHKSHAADEPCEYETYDCWYTCSHGHHNCKKNYWDDEGTTTLNIGYGQPLLIIEKAEVIVTSTPYTTPVNIRLTTKISIKKYAKEIKHATNGEITFDDNVATTVLTTSQRPSARKAMSDSDKGKNPVYAEYGDIIKYRIDVKNDQKYDVKIQLKDILPDRVKMIKRTFKDYEWLTIPGEKEVEYELILITEGNDDALYVNEVKLVTKNIDLVKDTDENVDFIRTTDNRVGPVVNLNEIDIPEDIISREYHKINDYDLDIDKYITDYNKSMMNENNNNVITKEDYDVSALNNNGRLDQRIERKKNYPVPVEKTEQFTYSIRMTNNSVKTGTNKVATKVRPSEIIDTLDKGLKYVSIKGFIYDSTGKVKYTLTNGTDFTITEDKTTKNKFYIKLNNMQGNDYLVIEPGEYLIYEMTVEVIESNMRLETLENLVNISILSNINNGTTTENISKAVNFTINNPICSTCGGSKVEIYYEKCDACGGKGSTSGNKQCYRCKGKGKIEKTHSCDKCNGTGLIEGTCNHVGTDRFYTCEKCGRQTACQFNAPAPTKCKKPIAKNECGSTEFIEKCSWCNRNKGNCTHYKYYCSGTSNHPHDELEVGKGANAPSVCKHKFTCDEYHGPEGLKTLYQASDNCQSYAPGKCPHGNDYGPYIKICNYCGAQLDKNATSCPKYTYTYKCPESGCTYTSNGTGKCPTHNKDLTFVSKVCNKHSGNLGESGTCNEKIRCKQTTFTKKCYTGSGEHSLSSCNHYKYVCKKCKTEYTTKPAKCTKKDIVICGGTFKTPPICMECNNTGKKKIPCPSCANKSIGTGEKKVEVTCPVCNGNKTVNEGSLCSTCLGTGNIRKTRSCTHCGGTGIDGDFNSERIVRKADGSLNRNLARNKDDDGDGTNEQSSEYVRMKDLVISGYVWLDMNRDGYMNAEDQGLLTDQTKTYYNIGSNTNEAGKQSVVVNLYAVVGNATDGTLIRTTQTDNRGRYTFSNYYDTSNPNKKELKWYNKYKASCWEEYGDKNLVGDKRPYERLCNDNPNNTPQRIDKATNKDQFGNYTEQSQYIQYYIEFEYDGIVYKSTEFYSGMDNLIVDKDATDYGEMSGLPDSNNKKKYMIDSNAAEFTDVREDFNKKYEYISYDIAYNDQKVAEANSRLDFDKTQHTSQLMEDPTRIATSRSFIKLKTMGGVGTDTTTKGLADTNTLWLFNHSDYTTKGTNHETPDTEYLKYINLGLELREDVDITLTKDVYSVKTLINGEEMEYFFNQNNAFNGETGSNAEGLYLNDFIIKTPYGLDLYESDYKMRVDQYASQAVKAYKGLKGESELNAEVTYRITVANKAINDDEMVKRNDDKDPKVTDTKLKVKVSEILDLYDTNFKEAIVGEDGKTATKTVKVKKDGYLENGTIAYAEAWYFKQDDNGQYIVDNNEKLPTKYENGKSTEKPVYIDINSVDPKTVEEAGTNRYTKVYLGLSNKSTNGDRSTELGGGNSGKENKNDFKNDGYYTLYITGMEGLEISEGQDFDIYVKYLLDDSRTETSNTTIRNEDYEDTARDIAETEDGKFIDITINESVRSAEIKRSLKILDRITKDAKTARGLEGIAQVNLYSVWYEDNKPASLVDMDANAGNIGNVDSGLQEKLKDITDTQERLKILTDAKTAKALDSNKTSADNWDLYEDITYKTGIEITADGSEWTKEQAKNLHGELDIKDGDMIRKLTGKVWDDSRSDEIAGTGNGSNDKQYLGNGKYSKDDKKTKLALANKNVPENYDNNQAIEGKTQKPNEEQDIKVRNVKAELIEIVEIPAGNGKSSYYEEVLSNVTWKQAQHIRTNATGDYELTGFIPGKYIVRFTYGDTVTKTTNAENNYASETIKYAAADMQVFNGQDYKTTKYAYNLSDYNKNEENGKTISTDGGTQVGNVPVNSGTIDQYAAGIVSDSDALSKNDVVMLALERPDLSDARDDEIRRLEVNNYSEIMVNEKAEVLKGLANNTQLSTQQLGGERDKVTGEITEEGDVSVNYYKNYSKDEYVSYMNKNLTKLTDNTNMNAETVEFLVKPEKLTYDQTNTKEYYTKLTAKSTTNKDYYYNDLDTIVHSIVNHREYMIENIDMGIEYRPETNISLGKEIDQILLVSSDQKVLANLKLYTEIKKEGNTEKVIHHVDMENSTGADKVQFVSNTYEVDKLLEGIVNIHEEHGQGLLYVAVDEELLQGCKVIVQYKFTAQNNSEVDRISEKLNKIRFYGNEETKKLSDNYTYDDNKLNNYIYDEEKDENGNKILLGKEYTANNLAKNKTYDAVYQKDGNGDIYRNRPKTMVEDSVNGSRSSSGYFGDYVGYTYYTGNDSKGLDTIAEMKFDRLIDYVDTDLEYVQLTDYEGKLLDTDGKTIMQNPEEQTSLLQNVSKVAENARTTKFLTSSVLQDDTTDTTNNNTTVDNSTEENTEVEDNAGTVPTEDNKKPELFDVLTDSTSDVSANDDKFWVTVSPPNNASTTNPGDTSGGIDYGIGGQERLFNLQMKQRIFRLGAPWSKEYFNEIMVGGQKDENKDDDNAVEYESSSILDVLVDMRGIQYKSLVMTIADKKSDNDKENKNRQFSKFLSPRVVAEAKEGFNKNNEQTDDSKAIIYLPVSKVLASETNTENMLYENIAEVIQFTVLTGRRTNFDTTIGNADIHVVHEQNPKEVTETVYPYEKYGSIEFVTAALEKDTSSTELITLTPPTGLMKNRRAIFEAMETTRDVLKITVIAVAVVVVAIVVTKFTMVKIKKRRYK